MLSLSEKLSVANRAYDWRFFMDGKFICIMLKWIVWFYCAHSERQNFIENLQHVILFLSQLTYFLSFYENVEWFLLKPKFCSFIMYIHKCDRYEFKLLMLPFAVSYGYKHTYIRKSWSCLGTGRGMWQCQAQTSPQKVVPKRGCCWHMQAALQYDIWPTQQPRNLNSKSSTYVCACRLYKSLDECAARICH